MMKFDSKIPSGDLSTVWEKHKFEMKLLSPPNRRKKEVLVVGTGLAGASAAATLAEAGYRVKAFCYHESPRRAHSIAAQGGINAAKNYQNDGDSVHRLFYETIKGGDFRSREGNVHRLAEVSVKIIDQCVAQGVPFAREYGGTLANRSFGGTQVSRTFYARGQTGQQLLLGAYGSLMRQVDAGQVELLTRREMLDLIIIQDKCRGVVMRNCATGELESYLADAVLLCTGGYSNVYYLSTNARNSNVTASWRAHRRGAGFANPSFMQIHPTCIPVAGEHQAKLTLMSESLRNDGRVWVPKQVGDHRAPHEIPEQERDYYLERKYPSFGNLVPRDVASRNAKYVVDESRGVGSSKEAVYLDFRDAIQKFGQPKIAEKYGNLFDIYSNITGENPYQQPMRIYPAPHYTMGGLWVDYHLMTNIPGLFALGEANFSDHGANRLGASALMQGLADGYFVIPYTLANYLASTDLPAASAESPEVNAVKAEVQERIDRVFRIKGKTPAPAIHRKLGRLMWNEVGMSRTKEGTRKAIEGVRQLREEFWNDLAVPGEANNFNANLEHALRLADFLEFAEIVAQDAHDREESCGCHFREEFQTEDGEARRDDQNFSHVAIYEYQGENQLAKRHSEPLEFKEVTPSQRSYK